jgi:hypothetical protein
MPRKSTLGKSEKEKANGKATGIPHNASKYDPAQYLIPARDHQGGTTREWFNVTPQVDHELNVVLASKLWPFRLKGDVIRFFVADGLRRLQKLEPVPGSMMAAAETIIETCRAQEIFLKFKSSIDQVEHTVSALAQSGNEAEVIKLLSKVRKQAGEMTEPLWRKQYMEEFDKRFGHIVQRGMAKAVRLNQAEKEE